MSESDRFDLRVAQLGEPDEMAGTARIVARAGGGAGGVIRALLNAVDETILPAELAFASEAGETLVLSAAARRIRSVVSASDDLSAEDLLDRELEADDEAGLRAALDLLDRFARGASGAVIVSEKRADETAARGVSATRLLGMLPAETDMPATEPAPAGSSSADAFLAAGGEGVTASVLRAAGGADVARGDADLVEALTELADGAAQNAGPAFDVWLRQTGDTGAPALGRAVWADGTVAALAFAPRDAAALAAAFQASCADT